MINSIIKGVFYVITTITGAILSPLISLISGFFPSLGDAISYATTYLTTILKGVPLALNLLMIPRSAVVFLFDYIVIKYLIYITVRAVQCTLVIYNKIKP